MDVLIKSELCFRVENKKVEHGKALADLSKFQKVTSFTCIT